MKNFTAAEISRKLRGIELFKGLTDEQFDWLAREAHVRYLEPGEIIIRDGAPGTHFYVLLSGELIATKIMYNHEQVFTRHIAPPPAAAQDGKPPSAHQFTGEISLLTDSNSFANVSAVSRSVVLSYPKSVFFEMIAQCPSVMRVLLPALAWRLKKAELDARSEITISALSRLAAGLAHELNNPVAAMARATADLESVLSRFSETAIAWGERSDPAERAELADTISGAMSGREPGGGEAAAVFDGGEAGEEMADWARAAGAADPFRAADLLPDLGVTLEWLRARFARLRPDIRPAALDHFIAAVEVNVLIAEAHIAVPRISSLVSALRDYTNLDRAPQQELTVTDGLESTLFMLRARLKGIRVIREYESGTPKILGCPSELNQVWTNLIDNAVDAMDGAGTLTIRSNRISDFVIVEICDTGCGIPPGSMEKIFQPFYTTKEIGKGTGLGLHLTHQIVTQRHGGSIDIASRPGDTRVSVYLPA